MIKYSFDLRDDFGIMNSLGATTNKHRRLETKANNIIRDSKHRTVEPNDETNNDDNENE